MVKNKIILFIFIFLFYSNLTASTNYNYDRKLTNFKIFLYLNQQKDEKSFIKNKNKRYKYNIIKKVNYYIDKYFSDSSKIEKIKLSMIVFAIIKVESNYNKNIIGDDGKSIGLMQIYKYSYIKYHNLKHNFNINKIKLKLKNPFINIKNGVLVLSKKMKFWNDGLINRINTKKFLKLFFKSSIDPYFLKFIPIISQYNGGIYNKKYVYKVLKQYNIIKNMI